MFYQLIAYSCTGTKYILDKLPSGYQLYGKNRLNSQHVRCPQESICIHLRLSYLRLTDISMDIPGIPFALAKSSMSISDVLWIKATQMVAVA